MTVYLDPETGNVQAAPDRRRESGPIWVILILSFFLIGILHAFLQL